MFQQPGQSTRVEFQQPGWPEEEVPQEVVDAIADDLAVKEIHQGAIHESQRILARKKGEKIAQKQEAKQRTVKLSPLSAVIPRPIHWLWHHRIPIGEITLVAGRGGIGKSLVLCTQVAWITTGDMKGRYHNQPRDVIFVANEDSYDRTVVPRLMAAGADLARVHRADVAIGADDDRLILPVDCEALAAAVKSVDAVAVYLDPLSSNMADKDRNSPEVRASYERLRQFADDLDIAVVGNAHTRKGQSVDLLEAIMGSSEIGNVSRAAMGVVRDPDSEDHKVILSQCKSNYGPTDIPSFTYTVQEVELDGGFWAPRIVWGDESERHVNDILSEVPSMVSRGDVDECKQWLHDYLSINPRTPRKTVINEGAKEGYKEATIKRAATRLGVIFTNSGFPRVTSWDLPEPTATTALTAQ